MDDSPCGCELCGEIDGILYSLEFLQSAFDGGLLVPAKETAVLLADIQAAIARVVPDEPQTDEPAVVKLAPYRPSSCWQLQD